ncbi:NAD(P)/FAD-dependent oxidoreductase [Rhodococcus sp. MTM3W5.2]|uniref:NAD(P)/FAD-dependent oxidoreductase n=1 Tax=Rhodococcus sp. MTM3W5.2 TaxID=1805827 RepID=UPI00097C08B2|nr:FAD-dependent oxidoreductase [Rhodococcus sp. MTM3W5.2]
MSARVVVVGAGYAGVMAANRLRSRSEDTQVIVVNPRPSFVERIRLHQLVTGSSDATVSFEQILHPGVELRVGTVERIDAQGSSIVLSDGEHLAYDHLIYAVGSTDRRDHIPGASEHAFSLSELEQAHLLRLRLRALPRPLAVTVIGGGLTGIEAAAEFAENDPELAVTLVSDSPVVQALPPRTRRKVLATLATLGVAVVDGVRVTEIAEGKVTLADGRILRSDCTVLATSFAVPDLARRSGLEVDAIGKLLVDATLTSRSAPSIVGAGDAVAGPADELGHLRMSCQAALPMGAHAADTILARLGGAEPTPLSLGFVGQCISLGRRRGAFQPTRADDSPAWPAITGRVGALVKEQVCLTTVRWMTKQGTRGAYRWRRGPR